MVLGSILAAAVAVSPPPASLVNEFASAWSSVGSYSATLSMHETAGTNVEDRTYAYTFAKPSEATIAIMAGPGRGGRVTWTGGDRVTGSPPGLLGAIKVHLSIHDRRVTSLRGDTVAMASFGWLLDHLRSTPGTTSQGVGPTVDGVPTNSIALTVAAPAEDDGVTREVVLLSKKTNLPVEFERYTGPALIKAVKYSKVVAKAAP